MQQVVLFSSDFEKESAENLKRELEKNKENQEKERKTVYEPIEADFSEPTTKLKDILERYKGINLGLPEEWFHNSDRVEVNIIQKNIRIKGDPGLLLLMPKQGTPLRLIVNDDFSKSQVLTLYFITNLNFGDPANVHSLEQMCDQKIVQIKGNIDLLNAEFEKYNQQHQNAVSQESSSNPVYS
ncbi:hypothetical protein [Rubrolithibacter danxiaensis]|uniref:hypothetical protein n=1 Tax=Rubrolithibacter danxiaensis TaxID=3390805 RepID=UPI003BF8FC8C